MWMGEYLPDPPETEFNVPQARPAGQLMHISVDEPLSGVAPGQTMVVYDGTRVLGQATIDRTAA